MYQPAAPLRGGALRSWQWFYANTTGLVGLLGSHMIDVGQWFTDDPFPSARWRSAAYPGRTAARSATPRSSVRVPEGLDAHVLVASGSGPESDYTVLYGKTRTLDTRDWTIRAADNTRPAGARDEVLPDPSPSANASLTQGGAPEHVANWIDCLVSRKQPNASIDVGYSHAVACCLGREAERTGRKMRYDAATRRIVEAVGT